MWQSQATTDSGTHTCLVQLIFSLLMTLVPSFVKITIRDGGSTTLYSANTVYTCYPVQTALHCLNSSMYAYIYIVREGYTLLEWADEGNCKMWGDGCTVAHPLDCYDY